MKANVRGVALQRLLNSWFGSTPCPFLIAAAAVLLWTGTAARAQNAEDYPLGDIPMAADAYLQEMAAFSADAIEALPASYDARARGIVTPAKNQGSCGSCWAFAAVGAIESHLLAMSATVATDLSEQQQVSCNTAMYGCGGGYASCIRFWETRGPIPEPCFPYTVSDSTACRYSCNDLPYRIVNYHTVKVTAGDFKASCYNQGPSYWRFQVYSDFSDYWNRGSVGKVYRNTGGYLRGGHAVLLIGWDDAKGAFLCKNSWGATRGPNQDGTFWIAYDDHANDLGFGMVNFDVVSIGGPSVTYFAIDGGAASTTSRSVTLNNICTGPPTEYMASESSSFSGASWRAYSAAPAFTLSAGVGTKRVYFLVRNAIGQSATVSNTIEYLEPPLALVYVDWRNTSPDADGSQAHPYPRVARGYARVADGGRVKIRAGNYAERMLFNRRLTLEAFDGTVRIGATGSAGSDTSEPGEPATAGPFWLNTPALGADGSLRMSLSGEAGRRYQVFTSLDLTTWELWKDFTLGSETIELTLPDPAGEPMRFFKVVSP